jgi:hypothetical protein
MFSVQYYMQQNRPVKHDGVSGIWISAGHKHGKDLYANVGIK